MKKILIVEDDRDLVKILFSVLSKFSRRILIARSHMGLERLIDKHIFELVIFDRMLSGQDSLPMLSYLRDISPQTKILILSSKAKISDRIKGLEEGADDYLPKPFSLKEFVLRVKTLLNSERIAPGNLIEIGPMSLDPENNELILASGKKLELRKREMDVLRCLARHRGGLVSRDKIISEVWPHLDQPDDSTVDVYIKRLRAALGDKHKSIIQNKRGMGYKLVTNSVR